MFILLSGHLFRMMSVDAPWHMGYLIARFALPIFAFLPLVPAVQALNRHRTENEWGYRIQYGLSPGAILASIGGLLLWAMILFHNFVLKQQ